MFTGTGVTHRQFGLRSATCAPMQRSRKRRQRFGKASQPDPESLNLIKSFVCQFDRIAVDTAVVLSAINALQRPHSRLTGSQIADAVPGPNESLPLIIEALSEQDFAGSDSLNLDPLGQALDDRRQRIYHFVGDE